MFVFFLVGDKLLNIFKLILTATVEDLAVVDPANRGSYGAPILQKYDAHLGAEVEVNPSAVFP